MQRNRVKRGKFIYLVRRVEARQGNRDQSMMIVDISSLWFLTVNVSSGFPCVWRPPLFRGFALVLSCYLLINLSLLIASSAIAVMTLPISLIWKLLQEKEKVQIWLYEVRKK